MAINGDMYKECYFCHSVTHLEKHHVFGGAYRGKSESNNFTVTLCHWCHNEPPDGVHFNKDRRNYLKRIAQKEFEQTHTREQFIAEFGKNYIMEDEE
jgi:hypothetical protein